MLISKEKISKGYFYAALLAFAGSACVVMRNQESDDGGSYTKYIIALAAFIWIYFPIKTLKKGYTFELPSFPIAMFNLYLLWVLTVTIIQPGNNDTITSYLNSIIWSVFPILILNATYYFVLHKGTSMTLLRCFAISGAMFILTYFSFYDTDNILMNVHLGSSYYALYILPIIIIYPSKTIKAIGVIAISVAVFSSVKRGGVLALALGMLAYIITSQIVSPKSKLTRITIGVSILLIFASVFIYIGTMGDNNIFERFETIQEDNGSGRTEVWEEAWRLINSQGILTYIAGNGFNTVVENSRLVLSAHDDYLEAWFDFGLIGLVLYVVSILCVFIQTVVSIYKKRDYAPAMALLSSILLVLSSISHIAIYYWFNIVILDIAYFFGLIAYEKKKQS